MLIPVHDHLGYQRLRTTVVVDCKVFLESLALQLKLFHIPKTRGAIDRIWYALSLQENKISHILSRKVIGLSRMECINEKPY